MTPPNDLAPLAWDPQPGEPGTSFAGFVIYREMRPSERGIRQVAAKLERSRQLLERYSARWRWLERTRAWDAEQARRRADHAREVEVDWAGRHMDMGRRAQAIALAGLGQLSEPTADGKRPGLRQLKPADLVRLLSAGASIESAAATHVAGTIEEQFVRRVVETISAVFVEANRYGTEEARAAAFESGCLRALEELTG